MYRDKRTDLGHRHYTCKTNMGICHKVCMTLPYYCDTIIMVHFRISVQSGKQSVASLWAYLFLLWQCTASLKNRQHGRSHKSREHKKFIIVGGILLLYKKM